MSDCSKTHMTDWVPLHTTVVAFITGGTFTLDVCSHMPNYVFISFTSRVVAVPTALLVLLVTPKG